MKVRELVEKLRALDQNLEVLCYTEDEAFISEGMHFRLFSINSVELTHVAPTRLADGTPYLKIGKSEDSVGHAILDVTSEF